MHLTTDLALQLAHQHQSELRQFASESRMGRRPRSRFLDRVRAVSGTPSD